MIFLFATGATWVQLACNWRSHGREIMCVWRPFANKLYPGGRQLRTKFAGDWRPVAYKLNCTRVAASCMQIVLVWPPVEGKFSLILLILHANGGHAGTICMWLPATRVKFISYWPPVACMQILHALAACCVQSPQFFTSTLREQLFELKNEDAMKKSENLHDTCP